MNICIIGAGAFGTAMAVHLSRVGHRVSLVTRRLEHAMQMGKERENKDRLPGVRLDENIQFGLELKPVLMEVDLVMLATPSKHLRSVCADIAKVLDSAWSIEGFVTLCKGLETETNKLPTDVVVEELSGRTAGALSGPSFADELANGKPTALVFASTGDAAFDERVQRAVNGSSMRIYRTDDLAGVELGSCLKNVYAIAAGISDGLDLGENARASMLTRALTEMVRIGTALGGRKETFYGLSGFGDLTLTCNGQSSRNRTFGERVARGEAIEKILAESTVEGYRSSECFHDLIVKKGLEAPILSEIYAVLYQRKSPQEAIGSLMTRDLKSE